MIALLPPILFVCFYALNMVDAILLKQPILINNMSNDVRKTFIDEDVRLNPKIVEIKIKKYPAMSVKDELISTVQQASEKLNHMKETQKRQNGSHINSKNVSKINAVNKIKEIAKKQDLLVKEKYSTKKIKNMSNNERKTITGDLTLNPKPVRVKNKKYPIISVKDVLISTVQQASEKLNIMNETLKDQNASSTDSKLVNKVNPVNKIKEIAEYQHPLIKEEYPIKKIRQLHPAAMKVDVNGFESHSPISPQVSVLTKKIQWHPAGIIVYDNAGHPLISSRLNDKNNTNQTLYEVIAAVVLVCVVLICLYLRYQKKHREKKQTPDVRNA